MKISVCTDMLFPDKTTAEAMAIVKTCGADAIEFWGIENKNLDEIGAASKKHNIPIACFGGPSKPALVERNTGLSFAEELKGYSAVADKLNCRFLIVTSGRPSWGLTPHDMHINMIDNLGASLDVLEKENLNLLIEPLNASELSYLQTSREAFDICRILNSPRIKVLFDLYHQQFMEGNLINTVCANLGWIGHFHAADLPARKVPGSGEINYVNILKTLRNASFAGYVGLEYIPSEQKEAELTSVIRLFKEV